MGKQIAWLALKTITPTREPGVWYPASFTWGSNGVARLAWFVVDVAVVPRTGGYFNMLLKGAANHLDLAFHSKAIEFEEERAPF